MKTSKRSLEKNIILNIIRMNVVISTDNLAVDNLTVNEFLSLLVLDGRYSQVLDDEILKGLEGKNLIKIGESLVELREEGIEIIQKYLIDDFNVKTKKVKQIHKKSERFVSKTVEENIDAYRELFRGLKVGSMGSLASCKEKLTRWMKENPDVTIERILKATQIYIGSVDNMKYLKRADYFIYKVEEDKTEVSTLSSIIDEVVEGKLTNNDWTSTIS